MKSLQANRKRALTLHPSQSLCHENWSRRLDEERPSIIEGGFYPNHCSNADHNTEHGFLDDGSKLSYLQGIEGIPSHAGNIAVYCLPEVRTRSHCICMEVAALQKSTKDGRHL